MPLGIKSRKLPTVVVGDFLGGLCSNVDPADLELNQSPDCENVYAQPGRLLGRLGYIVQNAGLPAVADGVFFFYDANGAKRLVVFSNGALYDVNSSFVATLVASGVYTAGKRVTAAVLNKILYFSDGYTIHGGASGIRYYDPSVSTAAAPTLVTSGTAGTIATPACKVLLVVSGQLLLCNIKYVGGTTAPHAVIWSNVNDPTTIISTNILQVSMGQGGEINCVVPLGLQSESVLPSDGIFVGKSEYGCSVLQGALSTTTLSEKRLNIPDGVLDGASAQFVPGPDGSGFIAFLGNSRRVWATNGLKHGELSSNIRAELAQCVSDRLSNNAAAKFTSVKNEQNFHYVLDCGKDANGRSTHFCFDWDNKSWWRYRGWPSGYWVSARDSSSQPALYVTDDTATTLCQANAGTDDNGTAISPYWWTPWIHGGDQQVLKIWRMIHALFRTNTGNVAITARVRQGEGDVATATMSITPSSDDSAVWDQAQFDSAVFALSGGGTFTSYQKRARLMVASSNADGTYQSLRGPDVQVKISQSVAGIFEVFSIALEFIVRGRRRVSS